MTRSLNGSQERERYRAFLSGLFAGASARAIVEQLQDLAPPAPFRIRVKPVYTTRPLEDLLTRAGISGSLERLSRDGPGYYYSTRLPGGHSGTVRFAILPSGHEGVSVVAAVSERPAWKELLRDIRNEYPHIVPINLSQRELLGAISSLRRQLSGDYELRLRELSAREKVGNGDGASRSVREWTDEDLATALSQVEERRQLVLSISLDFFRLAASAMEVIPSVRCKLSKASEIEMTGRFGLVWETVVKYVSSTGSEKLRKYSKRGLRENNFKATPLTIKYSESVFDRLHEVKRLVEVLSAYPKSMHNVQHRNPYAYVQIADSFDGSAFDVWALSPHRLTVVPRLTATEAAVGRLVQHIFDNFREGTVELNADT